MNIIYALRDPITDEYMYVGKSIVGIQRAKSHLTHSHNLLVQSWVISLMAQEYEPIIDILEECDNPLMLPEKEKFWVNKLLQEKHPLLNIIIYDNLADKHKEISRLNKLLDSKLNELNNRLNLVLNNKSIGLLIKERRKELNITQDTVAELAGISVNTLYKFERNQSNPTIDIVYKILDVLGMELGVYIKNKTNEKV